MVRRTGAALLVVCALASAGCAGTVAVEPAADGDSAVCRSLVATLPEDLAGLPRRGAEDAAGVAAWGDPAVLLRCGTDPIGPTDLPCTTVDGIDWVLLAQDESGAARFVTYGRVPGVEVEVPAEHSPAAALLPDLSSAVSTLPVERSCV